MVLTLEQFLARPSDLRTDVCIVGGGVVGLELAAELSRGSRRIVVLERRRDGQVRAADRVGRVRESGRPLARPAYGPGAWSGEWRLPDPGEWENRPWFGCDPAPLAWDDVAPFAREAMEDHAVPPRVFDESPVWKQRADVSGLAVSRSFVEQSPADLFAANFKTVSEAGNIVLVTGAIAAELLPAPGGGAVGDVALRAPDGRMVRVGAQVVVLATGPIDAVRVMLLSSRFGGIGPGNLGGLLGRGLMDHFETPLGFIVPGKKAVAGGLAAARREGHGLIEPRLVLDRERRQSLGVPAHAVRCLPVARPDKGALGGMLRGMMGGPAKCAATLRIEQTPNPVSAVKLDAERDDSGLPLADVRWELSSADEEGVKRFVEELKAAFGPQWGTLEVADSVFESGNWLGSGHLRGGAPIGASWRTGVVDRDCAVFGVQNLFVTGSAVVPVCGSGDPTLVTLALARRLAAHLAR